MSRFFWFANVLFRLSCNSPHERANRPFTTVSWVLAPTALDSAKRCSVECHLHRAKALASIRTRSSRLFHPKANISRNIQIRLRGLSYNTNLLTSPLKSRRHSEDHDSQRHSSSQSESNYIGSLVIEPSARPPP